MPKISKGTSEPAEEPVPLTEEGGERPSPGMTSSEPSKRREQPTRKLNAGEPTPSTAPSTSGRSKR